MEGIWDEKTEKLLGIGTSSLSKKFFDASVSQRDVKGTNSMGCFKIGSEISAPFIFSCGYKWIESIQ